MFGNQLMLIESCLSCLENSRFQKRDSPKAATYAKTRKPYNLNGQMKKIRSEMLKTKKACAYSVFIVIMVLFLVFLIISLPRSH